MSPTSRTLKECRRQVPMTKEQRAQVVELLRCAADLAGLGWRPWLDRVAISVGADEETVRRARAAGEWTQEQEPFRTERRCYQGDVMPPEWSLRVALEAALRVEQGDLP